MVGIYKITNLVNNKCYIGQSINIFNRWKEHQRIAKLQDDSRYNYPIYLAMRKYGLENFDFEIIEECSEEELNERESYWIKFYNSFEDGYNVTLGGDGTRKYDVDAIVNSYKTTGSIVETAKIFSCHPMTVRNIVHSFGLYGEEPAPKEIEQIDPKDLSVVASFKSIRYAAEKTGLSDAAIIKTLKGESTNAGGYYWRIKGENKEFAPIKKLWKRKVQQIDRTTLKVISEYDSCADAARALGKDAKNGGSQISGVCKGKKPTAYGYIWKYV